MTVFVSCFGQRETQTETHKQRDRQKERDTKRDTHRLSLVMMATC